MRILWNLPRVSLHCWRRRESWPTRVWHPAKRRRSGRDRDMLRLFRWHQFVLFLAPRAFGIDKPMLRQDLLADFRAGAAIFESEEQAFGLFLMFHLQPSACGVEDVRGCGRVVGEKD